MCWGPPCIHPNRAAKPASTSPPLSYNMSNTCKTRKRARCLKENTRRAGFHNFLYGCPITRRAQAALKRLRRRRRGRRRRMMLAPPLPRATSPMTDALRKRRSIDHTERYCTTSLGWRLSFSGASTSPLVPAPLVTRRACLCLSLLRLPALPIVLSPQAAEVHRGKPEASGRTLRPRGEPKRAGTPRSERRGSLIITHRLSRIVRIG